MGALPGYRLRYGTRSENIPRWLFASAIIRSKRSALFPSGAGMYTAVAGTPVPTVARLGALAESDPPSVPMPPYV